LFLNIGSADGIIIATIIASHEDKEFMDDANQVWPGIRIHIIDIVSRRAFPLRSTWSDRNKLLLTRRHKRKDTNAINSAGNMVSSRRRLFMLQLVRHMPAGRSSAAVF
jgi:hypothetical protein